VGCLSKFIFIPPSRSVYFFKINLCKSAKKYAEAAFLLKNQGIGIKDDKIL
jgi:hypothetical protein